MDLKTNRLALKVALIYVLVAGAWIILSDELLALLIHDAHTRVHLSIFKGWAFVLLTSFFLYRLIALLLNRWKRELDARHSVELKESQAKGIYRELFEGARDAVFVVDYETKHFLEANEAAEKMYGYTREEFLRMKATDISNEPEKTAEAIANDFKLIPLRMHRRKDGTVFPVEISGSYFQSHGRKLQVAAMRNISERFVAEAEIKRQAALIQSLLDTIPDLIFIKDLNGVYLGCNPAFAQFVGQSRETFLGKTDHQLFPQAIADDFREQDLKVISGLKPIQNEEWVTYPDGRRVLFLTLKTPHRSTDGKIIGVLGISRDITLRKQAEESLAEMNSLLTATLESTADGILVVDQNGHVASYNQKFLEMWRIPKEVAESRDDVRLLQFVLDQFAEPEMFLGKVKALYADPEASSFDELAFRDGRVFERYSLPQKIGGKITGRVWSFRDISARKWAEKSLRESEQRFRFVTENVQIGLVVINSDRRYVFSNTAYTEMLGLPSSDILGQRVADVMASVYEQQIRPRLDQAFAGERVVYELNKTVQGVEHFFTVTYEPTKADARTDLVVVVITDITSRKLVETALREREEQLLLFVKHSPAAIAMFNRDMKYLVVSSRWMEDYRLGDRSIIGKSHYEIFPDLPARWIEVHQRCLAGAVEKCEEEAIRSKDGRTDWIRWEVRPWYLGNGTVGGIIIFSEHITARKQAEQQLRLQTLALAAAANAIFITDRDGKINWANPSFTQMTGYAVQEVIGKNPRFLKSGQQNREFYQQLWNTILTGNVWHGELINRRKDGTLYSEDMTITPVRGEGGEITHFVAIKLDVTERRQLDIRLQQAEKMEAIGTLAGGIAHDFNNILAAMFGYGYLLDADFEGNAEAKENVGEILKAAARAKDLVQQILTFSRQREQKREVIHLNVVVKEAMKFLRASLPSEIKIEILLAEETASVLADPTKIYQVVLNLATNALHAMEGQQGRLTVGLSEFTPDAAFIRAHLEFRAQKYVQLCVADSGHGMDEKTIKRIFEPFFTTKAVGKGTGLGLSVVHGVVQSHDGHITVESKPGAGTTFNLYFPAIEGGQSRTPANAHDLPMGTGQKILVVDDERALTIMLDKLLRRLNYQPTTCNDPRETLKIFQADPAKFDLLITDLTMPEINGRELARQIHEQRPDLPILLASGFNAALTESDLKSVGIREILEKPISQAALAKALAATFNPATGKNEEPTS